MFSGARRGRRAVERQQRQDPGRVLIDVELPADPRQDALHRLQVEPAPRDVGGLAVGRLDRLEAGRLALGPVDPVERVALGLQHRLLGLAPRARNHAVVLGPRLVDHPVALLLRLVDLVPRRLDRIRRIDVLQDDLVDGDAHLVLVGQALQPFLDARLDLLAPDGEHLRHCPVADHLAHDRLVHGAEGVLEVAHLEEVEVRIGYAVLHDPLDHRHVEVARQHHGLLGGVAVEGGVLRADARLHRPEAELLLELPLHGHLEHGLRERDLGAQARLGGAHVAAEPEHHADLLRLHLVQRAEGDDGRDDQPDGRCRGAPREARQAHPRDVDGDVGHLVHMRSPLHRSVACGREDGRRWRRPRMMNAGQPGRILRAWRASHLV